MSLQNFKNIYILNKLREAKLLISISSVVFIDKKEGDADAAFNLTLYFSFHNVVCLHYKKL